MRDFLDVIREAAADAGLATRVDEHGHQLDNDLYPVTGPKHGPTALELAEDFAAFIRAFGARQVLVGCRRGGMVFTVPLRTERWYASRGRFWSTLERRSLNDKADDYSDLVPVQDWQVAQAPDHVKVRFRLEQDEDGYPPSTAERVWAVPVGGDRFRLDNIPWYARDVAVGDVVEARDEGDGVREFRHVVERSGHTTLRVVLFDADQTQALRDELQALGCDTELSHIPSLISVDVPAEVDAAPVLDLLCWRTPMPPGPPRTSSACATSSTPTGIASTPPAGAGSGSPRSACRRARARAGEAPGRGTHANTRRGPRRES